MRSGATASRRSGPTATTPASTPSRCSGKQRDWTKDEALHEESGPPGEKAARVPPGQYLTEKWPVLHYGPVPRFDPRTWEFRVFGKVLNEIKLSWEEFQKLPQVTVTADMHCVTTWSRLDQRWEGVPFSKIVELAKPLPRAKC